jgi:hypothetical protein
MSTAFPSLTAAGTPLVPSTLNFTAGVYPTKTYRTLAGTTVKRSFGNKPAAFQLGLAFRHHTDATAALILQHYYDTEAGFDRFRLSANIVRNMDTDLQAQLREPFSIRWEYAAPPELEAVLRNVKNINVQLTGELNV